MKHVTFTRDILPIRAGEQRLLPDSEATRLLAEGLVAPNAPDFPPRAAEPSQSAARASLFADEDQRRRRRIHTK